MARRATSCRGEGRRLSAGISKRCCTSESGRNRRRATPRTVHHRAGRCRPGRVRGNCAPAWTHGAGRLSAGTGGPSGGRGRLSGDLPGPGTEGSFRPQNERLLGAWLHGVSARVARRARLSDRRRRETQLPEEGPARLDDENPELAELRSILDEELGRLPEKYRRPVVLCYLEGQIARRSRPRAGLEQGDRVGTAGTCQGLAARPVGSPWFVVHRGPGGCLPAPPTASAAMPSSLLPLTVRAATVARLSGLEVGLASGQAAALARGILKTMSLGRIKVAVPLLLMGLSTVAVGASWFGNHRSIGPLPSRVRTPSATSRDHPLPHVVGVSYTPDGKSILSAQSDGLVRFWDLASTRQVRTINLLEDAGGGRTACCASSPSPPTAACWPWWVQDAIARDTG